MVLPADTAGLSFYASPLLKTGGLTSQIRRSLGDLIRDAHGHTVIKLRAFVAGAGDARRVQSEVSELFTSRKLPLPVLTILQVGGLGEEFAQVAFEAVLQSQQPVNPHGLVFFPGESGSTLEDALQALHKSATQASVTPENVLSCTCFAYRLDGTSAARDRVQQTFPHAAVTVVQAQRDPLVQRTMCQAVARLAESRGETQLQLLPHVRASVVRSPKLVFTGLQLSFGSYLDDAREAFQRLQRAATSVNGGGSPVEVNAFALDLTAASAIRKSSVVPSSTFVDQTIEGLPSVDASAGIEAVLAPGGPGF
jgi:enamine deaminase RidA (YjgF/YER057c/UK114 family)